MWIIKKWKNAVPVKRHAIGSIICFFFTIVIIIAFHRNTNIPCVTNSITNIYFAIFAISSIGIGLAYSNYEIEELRRKGQEFLCNEYMEPELRKLRDEIVLDINDKIGKAKPVIFFHGTFYFAVTIACLCGIISNELFQSPITREGLRSVGLGLSLIVVYEIWSLMVSKKYLTSLATSGYDETIETAGAILGGKYEKLLP